MAGDTDINAFKLSYGTAYAIKFEKNQDGTYTVTVCTRGQFKPKRKYKFK